MAGTTSLLGLMALALVMASLPTHAAPATCSMGFYNPSKGTDVAKSCVPCPKDFYSGDYGKSACFPCPANSTGPLGRWGLLSCYCQPGFRFDASFKLPKPQCSACKAGSYCTGGPWYDRPCPAGTYNPNKGAANISACLPCPAGTFSNTVDGAIKCTKCPAESSGPTKKADSCICPAGTYFDTFFGPAGCSPCPAGFFCPGGGSFFPQPCPAGSTNTKDGAKSAADCTHCAKGTYATRAGCTKCPKGTLGSNANSTKCLCPPGQEWQGYGMCTPCQAGNYCPGGDSAAMFCPSGTYNPKETSKSQAACLTCPANKYTISDPKLDRSGPTQCYDCPKGSTSKPGSAACACPAGQFWDKYGGCSICAVGTLGSPGGTNRCNCPTGTFWANSNYNGIPWCYACPSFTSGSNKDTSACVCPVGTYWTTERGDTPQCLKCPMNTYQPSKGSVADTDCIPCAKGYCSAEGAGACTPCKQR